MFDKTCVDLIAFIRTNEPKLFGVYKKSKVELVDIYPKLAKEEVKEEKVKEEEVKEVVKKEVKEEIQEKIDFSKLTNEELIFDIKLFL